MRSRFVVASPALTSSVTTMTSGTAAFTKRSNAPIPIVLQCYRLSPHLRETGRWPLRGEGQWRVGIRSSQQNLEAVGTGPWISRMRPF
jgi:hypothetical protein